MGDAFYPLKVSTVTTHEHTHVIRCATAMWKGSTSFLVVYLGLGSVPFATLPRYPYLR